MLTIRDIASTVSSVRMRLSTLGGVTACCPGALMVDRSLLTKAFQAKQIGYVEGGGMIALDALHRLLLAPTSELLLESPSNPLLSLPFFDMGKLGYSVKRFPSRRSGATRYGYEILDLRGESIADSSVYLKPVTTSSEPEFSDSFRFFRAGGLWYADGSAQTESTVEAAGKQAPHSPAGSTAGSSYSKADQVRDAKKLKKWLDADFVWLLWALDAKNHIDLVTIPRTRQIVALYEWAETNGKLQELRDLINALKK